MAPTIRVQNISQAALMIHLKGQISDGMWENANPHDHYKIVCEADVVIDSENPGLNFTPMRRYDFLKLLEFVEPALLAQAKVHIAFPGLLSAGRDFDAIPIAGEMVKMYDQELKTMVVRKTFIEEDIKAIEAINYGHHELVKDLTTLKDIFSGKAVEPPSYKTSMRTYRPTSDKVNMININYELEKIGVKRRVDGANRKIYIVDGEYKLLLADIHRWKQMSLTVWVELVTSDRITSEFIKLMEAK